MKLITILKFILNSVPNKKNFAIQHVIINESAKLHERRHELHLLV